MDIPTQEFKKFYSCSDEQAMDLKSRYDAAQEAARESKEWKLLYAIRRQYWGVILSHTVHAIVNEEHAGILRELTL